MTDRRQYLLGVGAQAWQRAVTIAAQVIVLPVMLHFWGAAAYGGWVALDSLRGVLAMADLGLAQVAANDMTAAVAAGRRDEAARIASAAWMMTAAAALLIAALGAVMGLAVPFGPLLNIDRPPGEPGLTFFLLSLVAAGTVLFGAAGGILRAEGLFWLMSVGNANFLLASAAAMAACAMTGGGYVALALGLLAMQVLTLGPVAAWALWRYPWARPRVALIEGRRIRRMLAPSLAHMLYTLTHLVTIQGVNILVAATLGPVAVTILSAIRTLTRLGRALAAIVIYPLEPVFARLHGQSAPGRAGALSRRLPGGGAALALAFGLPMAALGPAFLGWWTHGAVIGQNRLHLLMTAAIMCEILWFTLQTPYVATNRHGAFALFTAAAGILSTGLCALLLPVVGLDAAGWTLLAMQAAVLAQTLARSRRDAPVPMPA